MTDFDFRSIRPIGQRIRTGNAVRICVLDHPIFTWASNYLKEHIEARRKMYESTKEQNGITK